MKVETAYDSESGTVNIIVSDQGEGISPKNLKHIVDPFFTTKRAHGGTGLGLSISYKIVKDHDGEVSFKSKVGEGTVAVIMLPADDQRAYG